MAQGPANSQPLTVLGIDPGLRICGYGVIRFTPHSKAALLDGGVIRLNEETEIPSRLVELERELEDILREHLPDYVAVEMLYAHYAHPRTAILMGHARGVILLCARRAGARIMELPANRIKQSTTGAGHASKEQMQAAIQHYWNLPKPPEPPDVADALAIALTCARELESPGNVR